MHPSTIIGEQDMKRYIARLANSPSVVHDEDSKIALAISEIDASAIARGARRPALYSALAREPYK